MKYRRVIFLDGDNSDEAFKILNDLGEDYLFEYLLRWEYNDDIPLENDIPWGTYDVTSFHMDGENEYCVAYNWNLAYVSLTEVIHG